MKKIREKLATFLGKNIAERIDAITSFGDMALRPDGLSIVCIVVTNTVTQETNNRFEIHFRSDTPDDVKRFVNEILKSGGCPPEHSRRHRMPHRRDL
jgi:hypothetical protein